MNNLIKRILAYILDILIVTLIVQSLAGVPFINRDLNKYNKYYKEYSEIVGNYTNIKLKLTDYFKDSEISEEEYNKLIKYTEYESVISKYYEDNKINNKELIKINNEIDKYFGKVSKKVYYNIDKSSIYYFVIYIIVVVGYFILFNSIADGRTLGKKIMKLRIVDLDNKSVSIKGYIIRSLFLYQLLFYIIRLCCVSLLNASDYYNVINFINNGMVFLEVGIIMSIAFRTDGRGLHDLVAKTKVVRVDRQGNIVEIVNSNVSKKLKKEND